MTAWAIATTFVFKLIKKYWTGLCIVHHEHTKGGTRKRKNIEAHGTSSARSRTMRACAVRVFTDRPLTRSRRSFAATPRRLLSFLPSVVKTNFNISSGIKNRNVLLRWCAFIPEESKFEWHAHDNCSSGRNSYCTQNIRNAEKS